MSILKVNNQLAQIVGDKEALYLILDDNTTFKLKGCTINTIDLNYDIIEATSFSNEGYRTFQPGSASVQINVRPASVEVVEGVDKEIVRRNIDDSMQKLERALEF